MKQFIFSAVIAAIVLTACKGKNKPEAEADVTGEDSVITLQPDTALAVETIQSFTTAGFTDYIKKKSPSFDWKQFNLTTTWEEDSALITPFTPNKQFYNSYGRFLKYSPDSTLFIDLDSYNIDIKKDGQGRWIGLAAGPDTEVSLVNPATGQKTRLLFMGPGGSVEDAFWEDKDNLVLLGVHDGESGKALSVWKYHLPTNSWSLYELKDPSIADQLSGQWRKERLKGVIIK